jgi:hypothetical protein
LPDANNGGSPQLKVNNFSGNNTQSAIYFIIGGIPTDCTIYEATLQLYQTKNKVSTIEVHRITGTWSEYGITWNNSPSIDSTIWASFDGNVTTPVYRSINVSSLVESWILGTNTNHGFWLMSTSGSDEVEFNSRDAAANPPLLSVKWAP